jgi:hypothetical protein
VFSNYRKHLRVRGLCLIGCHTIDSTRTRKFDPPRITAAYIICPDELEDNKPEVITLGSLKCFGVKGYPPNQLGAPSTCIFSLEKIEVACLQRAAISIYMCIYIYIVLFSE